MSCVKATHAHTRYTLAHWECSPSENISAARAVAAAGAHKKAIERELTQY